MELEDAAREIPTSSSALLKDEEEEPAEDVEVDEPLVPGVVDLQVV